MSSRRYGRGGIFLVLKMGKRGKMERGVEARTARGLITVSGFGSEEGDPYHPTQSNSVTPASGVVWSVTLELRVPHCLPQSTAHRSETSTQEVHA